MRAALKHDARVKQALGAFWAVYDKNTITLVNKAEASVAQEAYRLTWSQTNFAVNCGVTKKGTVTITIDKTMS